jgi:hypothetical protein
MGRSNGTHKRLQKRCKELLSHSIYSETVLTRTELIEEISSSESVCTEHGSCDTTVRCSATGSKSSIFKRFKKTSDSSALDVDYTTNGRC